jgi:hypothetical protein
LLVMASFEERIYDLGREALAEQERQVAELRSRGSALLAAGAVIAGLLARPVFTHSHPHGVLEVAATSVGLLGAGALLGAVFALIVPYKLGFSVKASAAYRELWNAELLTQPGVDLALADAFDERRRLNDRVVRRLARALIGALIALVVETAGLASAAALAS